MPNYNQENIKHIPLRIGQCREAVPNNPKKRKATRDKDHDPKRLKVPPEPQTGPRPIHLMTIHWDNKCQQVRVLLDSGCSVPVLSSGIVKKYQVPEFKRSTPLVVERFDGSICPDIGYSYTYPLNLNLEHHWSRESFEVGPTDDECDIMMPWWWMLKNPMMMSKVGKIRFSNPRCEKDCTKKVTEKIDIEYDDTIASDYEQCQKAACLGYVSPQGVAKWQLFREQHERLGAVKVKLGLNSEAKELNSRIPAEYHEFLDVFGERMADALPPHRTFDHAIDLKDRTDPPWGPIYALSAVELNALREYLDEMLRTGKIRPSKSPAGAPILFVPKPHGKGLRLCVDYRGLNKITVLNRYPLPLMNELRDRVQGAKLFTKIDLKAGYNLIRIRAGDEWKTAFRTRYGHYEYLVMPFGMANAPASFQNMINDIFKDMIDLGVVAYIDDILIYSQTKEEHERLVKEVLSRLQKWNLAASIDKCEFHKSEIEFLGYMISDTGINMAQDKVQTVLEWKRPKSQKEVQAFMGFANFYRRFIKDFSKLAKPLTDTTAEQFKGKNWRWSELCEKAFEALKQRFTTAPVLRHYDPTLPIIVETDASDFAIGAVLLQKEDRVQPVAFYSRKMTATELNYDIHDKEMLAIVSAFKEWRRYLEGAEHPILVFSDHKNLEYFTTTKVLNRRQARWAQELAGYDFKIVYRPGNLNGKPDALSRRPEYRPEKGDSSENGLQPISLVLKPEHFVLEMTLEDIGVRTVIAGSKLHAVPPIKFNTELMERVVTAAADDQEWQEAYNAAKDGNPSANVEYLHGALYYKGRLWIPAKDDLRKMICEVEHDSKVAGHMGQDKTIEIIKRNFFWPGMDKFIEDLVRSCESCQRSKAPRHARYGLLSPLELAYAPWQSISMDFIVDLPKSNGHTQIWVIVDRFTKMAHLIPLKDDAKRSKDLAKIFVANIWRLHGLPTDIVSDRDRRFHAFWAEVCDLLDIRRRMSTAYHPETDGQTERVNQTLEQYLRAFCNFEQDNWSEMLPMAEYAYNNSVTSATAMSPFYANYGYHPRTNWQTEAEARNGWSQNYVNWISSVHELCKENLQKTRDRMGRYWNRGKKEPPKYEVGDLVMLKGTNLKTRRPSKKLDNKLHGPFQVEKVITSTAIRVTLPRSWGIHNVFHVGLLEPYRTSTRRGAVDPAQVLRNYDNFIAEDYTIEEIMGSSYDKREKWVMYLVQWLDYPDREDWTEEPFEHMTTALETLREFHRTNPEAPRDPRLRD